jgi:hypothetical protein
MHCPLIQYVVHQPSLAAGRSSRQADCWTLEPSASIQTSWRRWPVPQRICSDPHLGCRNSPPANGLTPIVSLFFFFPLQHPYLLEAGADWSCAKRRRRRSVSYLYPEVSALVFSVLPSDGRRNQLIVAGDLNGCRMEGGAARFLEEV